jgi:hypothetical protein
MAGAVSTDDAKADVVREINRLHEELVALGWTTSMSRENRMPLTPGVVAGGWYVHPDGRTRNVSSVVMTKGATEVAMLTIATLQGACNAGL